MKKLYRKGKAEIMLNSTQADAFKQHGWKEVTSSPDAVTEIEKIVESSKTTTTNSPTIVIDYQLNEMSKEELLAYAEKLGLKASVRASKANIIDAIRKAKK